MGQTKPVFVYRLVVNGTVDKAIDDLATRKKSLNDNVTNHFIDADGLDQNTDNKKVVADILEKSLRDFRHRGSVVAPSTVQMISHNDKDDDDDDDDWLADSSDDEKVVPPTKPGLTGPTQ